MLKALFLLALAALGAVFAIILVSMGRRRFYGCLDAKTAGEGERLSPSVLKTRHTVCLTVGGLLIAPLIFIAEYMIFLLSFDKYAGWGLSEALTAVVYNGIFGGLTAAGAVLAAVGARTMRRREAMSGGRGRYALGLSLGAGSLLMVLLQVIAIFKR